MPLKQSAHSAEGINLHNQAVVLGIDAAHAANRAYDELQAARKLAELISESHDAIVAANDFAQARGFDQFSSLYIHPVDDSRVKAQLKNAEMRFTQFCEVAGILLKDEVIAEY